MIIQLGWKYKFSFASSFKVLDGVYGVAKIYSYEELLRDKIDLSALYEKVGSSNDEFIKDLPTIRTSPIYYLINVRDESDVILIPEHLISLEPDPSIKKYYNSVITWNIGAFPDKQRLNAAQTMLSQLIERVFGTDKDPIILDIGVMWLTDTEFEDMENKRKIKQDAAFNWYSENQRIRDENAALRVKCAELEKIIIQYVK